MGFPTTGDLKIAPEYDCHSFWVLCDGIHETEDPACFGLSPDLVAAIAEWEAGYAATYVHDDPASSGFADAEQEKAFDARGLELAVMTANELGPGWAVRYGDTLIPYSGPEVRPAEAGGGRAPAGPSA